MHAYSHILASTYTCAGISVFVTGGIGGVHRGVEETMDVSADLTGGCTWVLCVCTCAGVAHDMLVLQQRAPGWRIVDGLPVADPKPAVPGCADW